MVMVEVGSVTFLDLVKQDQSSRESKRQARLQKQITTPFEKINHRVCLRAILPPRLLIN